MQTSLAIIKESASHEWVWLRKAIIVSCFAFFALSAVPKIDGWAYPVFQNISIDTVRIEKDRFCFVWHLDKKRAGKGIFYVAQVYAGDSPKYSIKGLEHYDGTSFGTTYSGVAPGHQDSDVCIRIGDEEKEAYRIGVRIFVKFDVDYRPWNIDQEPMWVDYYRRN